MGGCIYIYKDVSFRVICFIPTPRGVYHLFILPVCIRTILNEKPVELPDQYAEINLKRI